MPHPPTGCMTDTGAIDRAIRVISAPPTSASKPRRQRWLDVYSSSTFGSIDIWGRSVVACFCSTLPMLLLAEPMTASAIAVDRPLRPLLLAPVIAGVDAADVEQITGRASRFCDVTLSGHTHHFSKCARNGVFLSPHSW